MIVTLAGPGAGKTTDLIEQIDTVLSKVDNNREIAVITYTNASADDLKKKLIKNQKQSHNLFVGTIHSFLFRYFILPFAQTLEYKTKVAVVYVIFGLVIAVVGGTFIEKMHLENYVEDFIRNASAVDIDSPTLTQKERLEYAKDQVVSTFKKVFPYILVGVGIGALIHNWIPEVWVESILGSNNPFGVILATLIGIPMYADIFGTIPIAEALLAKGAQLGTILSFMMAVTTLSLPSLIMLRKAIKPKLLGIFIAICAIGIIVVGYVFNGLQNFLI